MMVIQDFFLKFHRSGRGARHEHGYYLAIGIGDDPHALTLNQDSGEK